jgi:tungstate transport system substrate-binding protein
MSKHIVLGIVVNRNRTLLLVFIIITLTAISGLYLFQSRTTSWKRSLVVSTTTSLYDTGVLDEIEGAFETENPIDLYFISVGTGLAIIHAKRGDADMILVHAPPKELAFMEEGYGVCRKIIAYNFFAIIGPGDDPAGISGLKPTEALKKFVGEGRDGLAIWVSRGDDSGTHSKEKTLWAESGFDVAELREEDWYREAGTGMGKTLQISGEFEAYTLTDMGTYLKYREEGLISLEILVGEGKELINVYSAIVVNPESNTGVSFDDAIKFIKYLSSEEGQIIFNSYGVSSYGEALFNPAVELLKIRTDQKTASWIEGAAFFEGSECPNRFRAGQERLYE